MASVDRFIAVLSLALATPILSLAMDSDLSRLKSMVQDADLRWAQASDDFYDAAFFGDGVQGGTVLRDEVNLSSIRLLLGHYQAITYQSVPKWEYCISRVYAASLLIQPKGKVIRQPVRTDIWTGTVHGAIETELGEVGWRAFADRKHHVIVCVASGSRGEEKPQLQLREEWGVTARYHRDKSLPENIADFLPPKPERTQKGEIWVITQKMRSVGAHVAAALPVQLPSGDRALIVAIGTSPLPDRDAAAEEAQADAVARVRRAAREGVPAIENRHRMWWREYWGLSSISIPDDPYWQRFWYLQLYKFASASSETAPLVIDTCGPWIWKSDWAAIWWNLNVQLSYMPMYSSNRLEVGSSLLNGLKRLYASGTLRANAGNQPGIMIGRSTDYRGSGSWGDEFGNLTWALHNVWKHWAYSRDPAIARALFPMLKDSVKYLSAQLIEGQDGKLNLRPSRSPEYRDDTLFVNANYSLMALVWGLETLISLDDELHLKSPERTGWRSLLARLVPYPQDSNGFRIAADQAFEMSHRHYSHLLAIYPFHTVSPEAGQRTRHLIQRSVDHWLGLEGAHAGYSFTGGSAMYSTLGQGDHALATLDKLKARLTPNSMYHEGSPVIETPLSAVESLNYMLIQSWGGVLRVFPAVPARWRTVEFTDLRAEGAFLVSSTYHNGKVLKIRLMSEKGLDCRIQNPWVQTGFELRNSKGSIIMRSSETKSPLVRFGTTPGETYILIPGDFQSN